MSFATWNATISACPRTRSSYARSGWSTHSPAIGRSADARDLFERLLARRNAHGLLAEHLDPASGEAWGNFVQTYSMVGLINAAIRLSVPWDDAF